MKKKKRFILTFFFIIIYIKFFNVTSTKKDFDILLD